MCKEDLEFSKEEPWTKFPRLGVLRRIVVGAERGAIVYICCVWCIVYWYCIYVLWSEQSVEPLARSENWSCVVIFLLSPKFSPITIPPLIGLSARGFGKNRLLRCHKMAPELPGYVIQTAQRVYYRLGAGKVFGRLLPIHFLFRFLTPKFGTWAIFWLACLSQNIIAGWFYSI